MNKALDTLYSLYQKTFGEQEYIFGHGQEDARIVLIGEAPGKDEVLQGKPFVGKAGQQLTAFFDSIGYGRQQLFITNAIKYRIFKTNPITLRKSNRPALRHELLANVSFLKSELALLAPQVIITLGNVPLQTVTGDLSMKIGLHHAKPFSFNIGERSVPIFPLYHPASIIYNQQLKAIYENDLQLL
ncbi:MAG: uracil-DNA glycosylase, partial [Hyphomonadaceae bacterium]|nr:uracil-DNA glycosylase [Clostridia bacterium]